MIYDREAMAAAPDAQIMPDLERVPFWQAVLETSLNWITVAKPQNQIDED